MLRIIAAAALAAILPLAAAAQETEVGIDQLKEDIMTDPVMTGVEVNPDDLTDQQVMDISGILQSDDNEDVKRDRVMTIIEE